MKKINKKYLDDPNFRRIMNSLMNVELTTVAASGYFDPLHVGHIEYLEMAKSLGDKLIVIVNSDEQAKLKKGKSFMQESDRLRIIKSLRCVDEAFICLDSDSSVCKSLRLCAPHIFEDKPVYKCKKCDNDFLLTKDFQNTQKRKIKDG